MNSKVILGSSLIFRILLCTTLVVVVEQSARADPWADSISPEGTSRWSFGRVPNGPEIAIWHEPKLTSRSDSTARKPSKALLIGLIPSPVT